MRLVFLIVAVFVLCSANISAQDTAVQKKDSVWVAPYEDILALKLYFNYNMLFVNHETAEQEYSFSPNTPPGFGIGIFLYNTVLNLSYGQGFGFMASKSKGKTRALDLQLHNYGRKFVFDLYFQRYRGFYIDAEKDRDIILCPDMKVNLYGGNASYVFNHKRFSYKAAFLGSEKQLRSAGSLLAGFGVYKTQISADSSFVFRDMNRLENFQFGINAGYAYTWVISRWWHLSGSVAVGINFGSDKLKNMGRKFEVYPSVFPRFATGYNREKWALILTYQASLIFPSSEKDNSIVVNTGSLQFSYIHRMDYVRRKHRYNRQSISP